MHYVKLIDMTSGLGHMDVNRISGYLPGKLVFHLMQVGWKWRMKILKYILSICMGGWAPSAGCLGAIDR